MLGPNGLMPPVDKYREWVFLAARGWAAVEARNRGAGIEQPNQPIVVLMPCSGEAATRLARVMWAMDAPAARRSKRAAEVRYSWNRHKGTLMFPMGIVPGKDYLAEGAYQEIFAVAQYDLALAIAIHASAQDLVARGKEQMAFDMYCKAFHSLACWDNYGSFRIGQESFLGESIAARLIAANHDLTQYERCWNQVLQDILTVTLEGRVAVIQFKEGFAHDAGFPARVPDDVLNEATAWLNARCSSAAK
jgi:hypothetical protein